MNGTEDQNIEELLNGFLDGELTARQQTEVQRLIAHDSRFAHRLQELRNCKMLVSSLPFVEAPAEMTDEIKTSLEKTAMLGFKSHHLDRRIGARHLFVRRLAAVAAMIGLVAVLASLIYTIVAPVDVADKSVAIEGWQQPVEQILAPAVPADRPGPAMETFNGRLELKTASLLAVSDSISRAIEDIGLGDKVSVKTEENKTVYDLTCSRESLNLLLSDLENIWKKFDSANLSLETGGFGGDVLIEAVTARQIADIANQDSIQKRSELAKNFAVLNETAQLLPGRELLAAFDNRAPDLITIPKPVLTSGEKSIKRPLTQASDEKGVHLTITVAER